MRRRFEHNSKRRRRHSLFQRNPQQFRRSHRCRLRWYRSGLFDDHRRGHRTRHDHLQRQRRSQKPWQRAAMPRSRTSAQRSTTTAQRPMPCQAQGRKGRRDGGTPFSTQRCSCGRVPCGGRSASSGRLHSVCRCEGKQRDGR